jgi:hypothetical protein
MINLLKATAKGKWPVLLPALLLGLFLPGISFPATAAGSSTTQQTEGLIKGKTKQDFAYMSGGVGIDERQAMEKLGKNYNLKLSFADRSGAYLDDVKLVIKNEKGTEVINTTTNGPWFYIELPPGKYSVEATFDGKTRRIKDLNMIKDKQVVRLLHWDTEAAMAQR